MNDNKKRLQYLDVCKALAIFLVILGDVAILYDERGINTPLSTSVHSFHTALFMFVSGIFFNNALKKAPKRIIFDNVRHLLLPYLSWSIICLFLVHIPNSGLEKSTSTILHFLKGGIFHEYWYLKCLFAYLVVTYFLVKIFKNVFAGCLVSYIIFTFTPSVFNTALFVPYFIAGHYCKELVNKFDKWPYIGGLFAVIIVLYVCWEPDYNYNISQSMAIVPYVVRTSIGCTVSLFIVLLFKKIVSDKNVFVQHIGRLGTYTLGIYCCREIFYSGFAAIILKKIGLGNSNLDYVVLSCIVLLFSYCLCLAIDKVQILSFLLLGNKKVKR